MNHKFLSEIISYVVSKGITLPELMDAYYERIYAEKSEVTEGDFNLLLCGRSVEESSTPCGKAEKEPERDLKPVSKSWIDYPKTVKNHGNGVSPARKALFDVVGDKTVIEHLKENGITYTNFDNRIRKNWSVAEACTTPLASWGKGKRKRVIEEPAETLETQSNTEKATETVENVTELNGNNVTAVIPDTPNPDAIRAEKDDVIEKALKKFVTHSEEPKKDKKTKEVKADLTVLEVCQKMNVTTHELREMINTGDFPQPDCDKKWSVKLLKKEGII